MYISCIFHVYFMYISCIFHVVCASFSAVDTRILADAKADSSGIQALDSIIKGYVLNKVLASETASLFVN